MSLEEVEAFLIKKSLARHGGSARKAAESLGLSRSAFTGVSSIMASERNLRECRLLACPCKPVGAF